MKNQKIIAVTGPSSSGKTRLAVETAKELGGEVVSVDSRQIYRELDIGSAKPSLEERQGVAHHLIDIIDVTKEYTVADFSDDANRIINEIIRKGKIPILAGGTGLYFRVLLQDFDLPRVAPDKELRNELESKSTVELYNKLRELDSEIAKKIHYNNKVKIIRALEVCLSSGMPMSKAQKKKSAPFQTLWYGLNCENRDFLYERINLRVDKMMNDGLLREADSLFKKYPDNKILLSTIGYQEFCPYLKKEKELNFCIDLLKRNTRRYAKRQISWFKANKDIQWFDIQKESIEEIKNKIINDYKNVTKT